tara:strand:+ start:15229 stop:16206 length:978 start_codon:yes stop_codon:yes gene_type:complete
LKLGKTMIKEGKLFKWIGGKSWLKDDLSKILNKYKKKEINYYIEPFAGSLGSFLSLIDVIDKLNIKTILLNDVNSILINTYNLIKEEPENLFNMYSKIEEEYNNKIPKRAYGLHKKNDKEELKALLVPAKDFFMKKRSEFNKLRQNNNDKNIKISALFLFLSQHCFNGIYRENNSGGYNSPYNWETGIANLENKKKIIFYYSKIFNSLNIQFYNEDVFVFLDKFKNIYNESLIYCDPPYLNDKKINSKSENKYNKEHFTSENQIKLLNYYKEMDNIIFSNHFNKVFSDFCKVNSFKKKIVYRTNIMSSKAENRGNKVKEIIAYKV